MLVVALAMPVLASSATAHGKPVLGIVPHPVVNVSDAEKRELSLAIGQAIARHYDLGISKESPPQSLPDDCVGQPECIRAVGEKMHADHLLFLVMVRVGQRVQVDPTWVDVSTGRTSNRDPVVIEGSRKDETLREVAPALVPRGAAQPAQEPKVATKPPPPSSSKAGAKTSPDPWRDSPGTSASAPLSEPEGGSGVGSRVWIATGVAAVALIVGLTLVVGGGSDYNAFLESGCDVDVNRCRGDLGRFQRRSLVANLFLAGAAAAGATAIMLYVDERNDGLALGTKTAPFGLSFGGSF
jgi:hypothetical protein